MDEEMLNKRIEGMPYMFDSKFDVELFKAGYEAGWEDCETENSEN